MTSTLMDRRIVVKAVTETPNSFGEIVKTLTTLKTIWARVLTNSGNENFESDRTVFRQTRTIEIWYDAEITVEHYIEYENKTWDILDVQEIGRRNKMRIFLEEHDSRDGI